MVWVVHLEQHGGLDGVLPHEAHLPPWRSCNQAIGEDDDEDDVHLMMVVMMMMRFHLPAGERCPQRGRVEGNHENHSGAK